MPLPKSTPKDFLIWFLAVNPQLSSFHISFTGFGLLPISMRKTTEILSCSALSLCSHLKVEPHSIKLSCLHLMLFSFLNSLPPRCWQPQTKCNKILCSYLIYLINQIAGLTFTMQLSVNWDLDTLKYPELGSLINCWPQKLCYLGLPVRECRSLME